MTTPGARPKKGDAVRVNDRFQVDDGGFAERLWAETGLRGLVMREGGIGEGDEQGEKGDCEGDGGLWGGEVVGLNPSIRVYRYTPGQFFAKHCELY